MRFYFVRFLGTDLTRAGNVWRSPVVDLYQNDSYANYSVTKSSYGIAGIYTGWIGTNRDGVTFTPEELRDSDWDGQTFTTDSGEMVNGRFIDTSGRVDLVSYSVDNTRELVPTLRVYTFDSTDDEFYHEEWVENGPFLTSDELGIIDSGRYAIFEVSFDGEPPADFELLVRVEIDQPIMAPMYRQTRRMLDQFPEWMALRELDNNPDTPQLTEPQSLGGKVLNALAGRWLDDIDNELVWRDYQRFITTVDLSQIAWAWKAQVDAGEPVWSVEGDGITLARAFSLEEFYDAAGENVCFIENDVVYTASLYGSLVINGIEREQEPHHTWNALDEIGLLVDLNRLNLEDNATFQKRILDVHKNRGGVGVESLKKALRRELNLWKYMATPSDVDSDYNGAYPEFIEIGDIEQDPKYFSPDGLPTEDFERLVAKMSREYPTTWGRFRWGKMLWDLGGLNHEGYGILPYQYDVDLVPNVQPGVGDGDDLFVFRPDVVTGAREFNATITARGRRRTVAQYEYRPVELDVDIRAIGTRDVYVNPVEEVWFTVEVETTDGDYFLHSFELASQSDVSATRPSASPETYTSYEIFSITGDLTTESGLAWYDLLTDEVITTPIAFEDIAAVKLYQGKYGVRGDDSIGWDNFENSHTFEAWFSMDDTVKLRYNSVEYPTVTNDPVDPTQLPQPVVVFKSLTVASSPMTVQWTSEPVRQRIKINQLYPLTTADPQTVRLPQFSWPQDVANRNIEIRLATVRPGSTDYGATTQGSDGEELFLAATSIYVDGSSSWSDNAKVFPDSTESVEFSTGTSTSYPIPIEGWEPFIAEGSVSFAGVVDENGPWRNDEPPKSGSTSTAWRTVNLTREDIGVPNDDDHIVTWLDVTSDNEEVSVWLNNNTVKTAVSYDPGQTYPDEAIEEALGVDEYGQDAYSYESFLLHARLRMEADPSWNPQIHNGYFYIDEDEYFFYADAREETVTGTSVVLADVARQGAPIIVHKTVGDDTVEVRQVAFFDETAESVSLSLTTTQYVNGSGIDRLYLAYSDVYDVTVYDVTDDVPVAADTETSTHELPTTLATHRTHIYAVTYKLRNSFYADYDYIHTDGSMRTRLVFNEAGTYTINYETADYEVARDVTLPLNPLYTSHNEGFIFISNNEYTLDTVRVSLSPTSLIADGEDYLLVTLRSIDTLGNPKANQEFTLSTDFGTLDDTTVTTDDDGFAVAVLTAGSSTTALIGTVTISGDVDATATFDIAPHNPQREPRILVVPNVDYVQAGTRAQVVLNGRFEQFDPTLGWVGLSGKTITWKKARSIYELFGDPPTTASTTPPFEAVSRTGTVTTNADGKFEIGPFFVSDADAPGYWFVSVEGSHLSVEAGDVAFWCEYPAPVVSTEDYGIPTAVPQMYEHVDQVPWYQGVNAFPVNYDETVPYASVDLTPPPWLPPRWYAINKYVQYQMALFGDSHNTIDYVKYEANRRRFVKDM